MNPLKKSDSAIRKFTLGPMAVNCYVAASPVTKEAFIVDPGASPEVVRKFLDANGLSAKFIIDTHGHADHIAANGYFGIPIYIHRLDEPFLQDPDKNLSSFLGFGIKSPKASRLLEDKERIKFAGSELEIIHTPGHTPGSISVRMGDDLFTGDALFAGGIGRSDFEYGDGDLLLKSIRDKLLILGDKVVIHPGHGDGSTIGYEKRHNPFLAQG